MIVVDNASEQIHRDAIKKWNPILSKQNLGYGGGNNLGIVEALSKGADYVLILNNDTKIEADFLDKIPKKDISGPIVDKIKWFFPQGFPNADIDDKHTYISGAAILISKAVFNKIGMFDDSFFLYFEDADFCFRAKQNGFSISTMKDASIYHESSASFRDSGNIVRLRYNARNAHYFFYKHAPYYVKMLLPFWSFFVILAMTLLLPFRALAKGILFGTFDFYLGKTGKI